MLLLSQPLSFYASQKDTTFISLAGIFVIALWTTHSFSASVSSLFHSFTYAAGELLPTIFIICFIVAMSGILTKTGINEAMISPFAKLMKGPAVAYWVIGGLMFAISLFSGRHQGGADRRSAASRSDPGGSFSDRRSNGDEPVRPWIRFIR